MDLPAPVASASMASTSQGGNTDHSSRDPSVPLSASYSFDNASISASTQASRVGHIISASACMSEGEFERLRQESRQLKAAHEAQYGVNMAAASRDDTVDSSIASTRASTRASSTIKSNGRPNGGKARDGSMSKHKEFHHSNSTSTRVISNKSPRRSSSTNGHKKATKKGVVKMTTNGLSKIRGILHMGSSDSRDDMSFYCSDENTGRVAKKKVSLDKSGSDHRYDDDGSDGYTNTVMNQVANDKRAGSRTLPQSPMTTTVVDRRGMLKKEEAFHIKPTKKASKSVSGSVDTATNSKRHGLGPKFEEVAKTAGTGIAATAMGVIKVTQQSVEGVGMLAKDLANAKTPARSNVSRQDLANAKTPARSNVTRHQVVQQQLFQQQGNNIDGRYGDYVHDPNYKVVLTPPPHANDNAGKTPYAYCDPKTPACLMGAVTAGRCNLPGSHPESLEFLPDGIPRVLVVLEDWEERAGFVPNNLIGNAIGVTGEVGVTDVDVKRRGMRSGSPRISNPIDMDEETDTVNGEEVDRVEMMALKEGRPSPRNSNGQSRPSFRSDEKNGDDEEEKEANEDAKSEEEEEEENDPRNASMWVAAPADIEDDDEDLLDSVHVGDINMGELLLDQHEENMKSDLVELAEEYDGWTPTSVGSGTFFLGDVQIGFESTPENLKKGGAVAASDEDSARLLVEDAKQWAPESKLDAELKEKQSCQESENGVLKAPFVARKIEDFDVCQKGQPQDPSSSNNEDDDSLLSLAKSTTAAVVHDKTMSKQVLFAVGETRTKELYSIERVNDKLYLNPSESTDLSHEPPVKMVGGDAAQELYLNPSESTDLSQFSNWKDPNAAKEEAKDDVRQSSGTGNTSKESKSGKRQLKGRVILVRIKKKISKVAKKMLFKPFGGKEKGGDSDGQLSSMGGSFAISLPKSNNPIPTSPSTMSGMSISSSIMTGNGSNTKRIIGAVPHKNGAPYSHQFLYGAINYGNRSSEDSTYGSDALPSPPASIPLPPPIASGDDEDAVSYLAEAMRIQGNPDDDDDEDSVLLLLTPRDDGTEECQVISAADGTPVQVRDIIEAGHGEDADVMNSDVKPNNLACLFTDETGGSVHGTPIEIMDAIEVEGGIVLTPRDVNHNVSDVFRTSADGNANLLPESATYSDDEDETLLYHDGCTVIHQASTFGDNTIATMTTLKDAVTDDETKLVVEPSATDMGIGTPIRSPDGIPLTQQAAKNGSFLFSPDNMGRANPLVRAKERAILKEGKVKPSITMLPSIKQTKKSESAEKDGTELVIRQSYSYDSSFLASTDANLQSSNDSLSLAVTHEEVGDNDSVTLAGADKELVEDDESEKSKRNAVMASMTEDRQFSYNTLLNQFSTDASLDGSLRKNVDKPGATSSPQVIVAEEEEKKTPLVSNAASTTKYPVTPFPETETEAEDVYASPLLVTLNTSSPSPSGTSRSSTSPSSASIASFRSANGRKKGSPKYKSVPKSALKTRKGFVKERVTDIQQHGDGTSVAVTDMNGRLKRNHSYRLKNSRRVTNGNGVLAPRKAVLKTTYIRSVPIGIAKSYSRDSACNGFGHEDGYSIITEGVHKEDVREEIIPEDTTSYAFKYTEPTNTTIPIDSFDESPPGIAKGVGSGSVSDASSYVSETTDSDPFSSLLGRMTSEDEESRSSEDDSHNSEDEGGKYENDDNLDKENANSNYRAPLSANLPFKSSTLVKPTEIHQHQRHQHEQQRPALSPMIAAPPMQARKWRTMAAAAAERKGVAAKSINTESSRFRSEKSWRHISGKDMSGKE